jgi:hypothetical protein
MGQLSRQKIKSFIMNRYVCEEEGEPPRITELNADIKSQLLISVKSGLLWVEA